MVGRGLPAPTTEPDVTVARTRPTGEIVPRRGNVHDVEHTVTHERGGGGATGGVCCGVEGIALVGRRIQGVKSREEF